MEICKFHCLAIEILEPHLNLGEKRIIFTNSVVDLQDIGTREIKIVPFNYEYDLQITANSMLVNADAGLNIIQAIIPKDLVKT